MAYVICLSEKKHRNYLGQNLTEIHTFRDEIIVFSEEEETGDNTIATSTKPNTTNDQQNLNTQTTDSPTTDQLKRNKSKLTL